MANAVYRHYFRVNDPGHACFMELYPMYAPADNFGGLSYEDYVEAYLASVKPFALVYDYYPFMKTLDMQTYHQSLHLFREKSMAHGLTFWQILLAIPHGDYRAPTEAEKRYQVMQALAFGAQAIVYFTYSTPRPDDPFFQSTGPGIVDYTGLPSPQYEEVKRINADVRVLGKYLLSATSTMVYEVGALPLGGTPAPSGAPVQLLSAQDVTVGIFSRMPYQYALLASRDYKKAISTDVVFSALAVQRLDKTKGTWSDVDLTYPTHVVLAPGDAELYRFI